MNTLVELVRALIMIVFWLAGIVLAHGAWSTLFAVLIPPYAWYLVVERAMLLSGWLTL